MVVCALMHLPSDVYWVSLALYVIILLGINFENKVNLFNEKN